MRPILRSLWAALFFSVGVMSALAQSESRIPQRSANPICTSIDGLEAGKAQNSLDVGHNADSFHFSWNSDGDRHWVLRTRHEAPGSTPLHRSSKLHFTAVPKSSLISDPSINIHHASTSFPAHRIDILARLEDSSQAAILAIGIRDIDSQGRALAGKVTWKWVPQAPDAPRRDAFDLAALESLYVQALSQDPAARYSFTVSTTSTRPKVPTLSSAELPELLEHIAVIRSCFTKRVDSNLSALPWEVASLKNLRMPKKESDATFVALSAAGKPISGVRVFLDRAPHYACSGLTNSKGVMSCVLEDTHGHEHVHGLHDSQESAPIIASYPGRVTASGISLPTAVPMWFPGLGRGR